ncbi:hypothetical protein DXG01_006971 [Tephrocybe rancida]|nr:hypothetical protein DXG01_006971 [Tephrocybe rancida]
MAPTTQNGVDQFTSVDSEVQQQSTFSRSHGLYRHQRSAPELSRRQDRENVAQPLQQSDDDAFEPYKSPISLHANITPLSMSTSQGNSRIGHLSITELILISSGALIAVVLGMAAVILMRSIISKKTRRLLSCGCGRQKAKKNKAFSEDKGVRVQEEIDDPTWGTPPRIVYVERINDRPENHHLAAFSSPDSPPSPPATPIWRANTQHNSYVVYEGDSFRGRLEYEGKNVTLALSRALQDITVEPDETTASVCSMASANGEFSSLEHLANVPMFQSLQASIDHLAKGISSPPAANRPRQGSDASASSRATTTTGPDVVDCFSVMSSESSATSLGSSDSDFEEPEEMEVVYEVRRAHAQSVELKKGILVTCRHTSSSSDVSVPGTVPTFVISEAAPALQPLDDQNFAPLFSLEDSASSKASLASYGAAPSLSSIVRENSGGTMASFSTSLSTTQTETWCRDDDQRLQPPVPYLMLTRPSDSSIYTTESFTSSVSVDLCDFPLPPIPAKPSYLSKLVDQVHRTPKRIWDNHSADSSASQKRSTVERFIMMYSTRRRDGLSTIQPSMSFAYILSGFLAPVASLISYLVYENLVKPQWNPLHQIAGPPVMGWFKNHLFAVLEPSISPKIHERFVQKFGRSIRIRGIGPWDERLLTLDPLSVAYVLKNSTIYEKPWQSRRLITSLIGCGMLSAEGQVHKRQRRVATPSFSIQNMRALVPLVFRKGGELKDRWADMISMNGKDTASGESKTIDVCHWVSRATFDVIGAAEIPFTREEVDTGTWAGFGYEFNAIKDETNELFCAYKEMFEVAISQGNVARTLLNIYFPYISRLFPDTITHTVERCQNTIHRVAGQLIQENKRRLYEAEKSGSPFVGKDLLSLLLKSNAATDLPPEHRISDDDILHNINTFMFAGSDTSSLTLTWTLLLLAQNPGLQTRLRDELFSVAPPTSDLSTLTEDEIHSLHDNITNSPFLDNDDVIPTSYPVHRRDSTIDEERRSVTVPKGSFVHVAIEGFNLDKEMWGQDAWIFNPDRWDNLPEAAAQLPGLYSNTLSFSAGPRSCIGMRFSLIEIKTFLYILLTNFVFKTTDDKIFKANV